MCWFCGLSRDGYCRASDYVMLVTIPDMETSFAIPTDGSLCLALVENVYIDGSGRSHWTAPPYLGYLDVWWVLDA